ncbi:MAG: hypothetical protein DRJ26_03295 [Candidatus Methanomethylicota archaeon]|uniref:Uncharacterized protein n=1 Tax=Thermoproteota archaeon TaxID=2056631 RepID=A0A497F252_9CREN|nr:MAG: hypothetical protein DRJ26_03295 [Candidatus Verstraetearchaeota archaeon]
MNKLGFSRIFEALLALMIIVTPLIISYRFQVTRARGELRSMLFNALVEADEDGELTKLVYSKEWDALYRLISRFLSFEVNFILEVLDGNGRILARLSKGVLSDGDVAIAKYVITFRGEVRVVILKGSW